MSSLSGNAIFPQDDNGVKVIELRKINVTTAIAEYSNLFGSPSYRKRVAVSGNLIVTSVFSYLVTDSDDLQGVLILGKSILDALSASSASPIAGTMVMYYGSATCVGCLSGSGIPMFPAILSGLSEFTFQDAYCDPLHFTLFHPVRSLFINGYTHLTTQQMKVLWQLLGKPPNMLRLRAQLCDGGQHLIQSNLTPNALDSTIRALQAVGITNLVVDYSENAGGCDFYYL